MPSCSRRCGGHIRLRETKASDPVAPSYRYCSWTRLHRGVDRDQPPLRRNARRPRRRWVHLYGLSIVADAWKSIGLIFIVGAFRQLRLVHGAVGSAAWIVCVIYSLSSALGYAAESRSTMVGWQTTKSGALAGYQGELQRKQRQLDAISHHEPASVTLQKLAVERQKRE